MYIFFLYLDMQATTIVVHVQVMLIDKLTLR